MFETGVDGGPASDGSAALAWRGPGEILAGHVAVGQEAVVAALEVGPVLPRVSGNELVTALEDVDRLRAKTETLTVRLVIEAGTQFAR